MTLEVRLRPEAELGLADAAFWYEAQQSSFMKETLVNRVGLFVFAFVFIRVHSWFQNK